MIRKKNSSLTLFLQKKHNLAVDLIDVSTFTIRLLDHQRLTSCLATSVVVDSGRQAFQACSLHTKARYNCITNELVNLPLAKEVA